MKKVLALVCVFVLVLAGCSSTTTQGEVEYDNNGRTVMIPSDPQSIVTDLYTGQLLSIGANVVGGDLTYKSPAWGDLAEGVTDIGQSTEVVASLAPDLIIISDPAKLESYEAIAPTILLEYGTFNEEELVLELGTITNNQDEAKKVVDDFNARITELQPLADQVSTLSILEFFGNDPYLYGNNFGRLGYAIYDKFNIACTQKCEENVLTLDDSYLLLTQENIGEYMGDVVIMSSANGQVIDNPITNSDVFKNSAAVKNDNVFYVDSNLFYQTDMISIMAQLDVFEEILNEVN